MNYDLFELLCRKNNTTPTALTNKLGLSKGNSSSWKRGGNPSADVLIKLADELNCTVDELLGRNKKNTNNPDKEQLLEYYNELDEISKASVLGKAEGLAEAARRQKALAAAPIKKEKPKIIKPPEPEPSGESEDEDETEYLYMPFFDLPVSAGTGVYLDSKDAKKIRVPADDETRKSDYVLRVSGDSMEPRYYDGDLVLVKQQQHIEEGEVGIFLYNGEGYIKIFGGDRLISLNPNYKDKIISENDQFLCLGKVMGILSIQHKFR